jgi:hypothetical protein
VHSTSTGVEDISSVSLKIYPNPFKNKTRLEWGNDEHENFTINLIDINGRLISTWQTTDSNLLIDRGHLVSGVYLLQLKSASQTMQQKLTIE